MPNFASALKPEIARIARKETRSETEGLRKALSGQRSDLAALKRRAIELEKALKALVKKSGRALAPEAPANHAEKGEDAAGLRFRPQGLASNRKRLGLSAKDFGLLVGASGQAVYYWESGKTKPRAKTLAAIAALRGVGKREVAAKLEALKQSA